MPLREGMLSLSTDGVAWTNYSGWTAAISQSGGERAIGGAYTFDGDMEIVTTGKRAHLVYTIRMIYTEESAPNPFPVVENAYLNRQALYFRWVPFGGVSGNWQFISDVGWMANPPFPFGEANDPNPASFEFELHTRYVTRGTYVG
ncbi:MAG: hypothetical protein A2V79_01090 [Betaproteobacteria bacterium RBG_16_56_24]|nr:MAG: hypothetical protein A2V79_01090 [Betaproteobacteria bacterium RBG_16_56_24]